MIRLAALFLLGLVAFEIVLAKRDINAHKKKFDDFKKKHGRKYKDQHEHDTRFNIFSSNLAKIEAHNEEYDAGTQSFQVGVNRFTDLTEAERAQSLGFRPNPDRDSKRASRSVGDTHLTAERMKRLTAPPSFDWRNPSTNGIGVSVVSNPKDQGYVCGSCWTFSATGVLESAIYIKQRKNATVLLSEQNLVDCDDWSGGCNGGDNVGALEWIQQVQNNQIDTEAGYPYEGQNANCRFNPATNGLTYKISSVATVNANGDENAVKIAVANVGPVTAAIHGSNWRFQQYTKGVFIFDCCPNTNRDLNHAVLIVGYGTDPVQGDYWVIKNSWGDWWGEQGYVRMARNRNNTCGVASYNGYPILA